MIDVKNLDAPAFTVEQTAYALDRSFQLIKKWQAAGIPLIQRDDDPGGPGRGRKAKYTLRTVLTLALMVDMTAWGVPAEIAWKTAALFSHVDGVLISRDDPFETRHSGELFKSGQTWLVIENQREIGKLINVPREAFFDWPNQKSSSALLINVENVIKRVLAKLQERAPAG